MSDLKKSKNEGSRLSSEGAQKPKRQLILKKPADQLQNSENIVETDSFSSTPLKPKANDGARRLNSRSDNNTGSLSKNPTSVSAAKANPGSASRPDRMMAATSPPPADKGVALKSAVVMVIMLSLVVGIAVAFGLINGSGSGVLTPNVVLNDQPKAKSFLKSSKSDDEVSQSDAISSDVSRALYPAWMQELTTEMLKDVKMLLADVSDVYSGKRKIRPADGPVVYGIVGEDKTDLEKKRDYFLHTSTRLHEALKTLEPHTVGDLESAIRPMTAVDAQKTHALKKLVHMALELYSLLNKDIDSSMEILEEKKAAFKQVVDAKTENLDAKGWQDAYRKYYLETDLPNAIQAVADGSVIVESVEQKDFWESKFGVKMYGPPYTALDELIPRSVHQFQKFDVQIKEFHHALFFWKKLNNIPRSETDSSVEGSAGGFDDTARETLGSERGEEEASVEDGEDGSPKPAPPSDKVSKNDKVSNDVRLVENSMEDSAEDSEAESDEEEPLEEPSENAKKDSEEEAKDDAEEEEDRVSPSIPSDIGSMFNKDLVKEITDQLEEVLDLADQKWYAFRTLYESADKLIESCFGPKSQTKFGSAAELSGKDHPSSDFANKEDSADRAVVHFSNKDSVAQSVNEEGVFMKTDEDDTVVTTNTRQDVTKTGKDATNTGQHAQNTQSVDKASSINSGTQSAVAAPTAAGQEATPTDAVEQATPKDDVHHTGADTSAAFATPIAAADFTMSITLGLEKQKKQEELEKAPRLTPLADVKQTTEAVAEIQSAFVVRKQDTVAEQKDNAGQKFAAQTENLSEIPKQKAAVTGTTKPAAKNQSEATKAAAENESTATKAAAENQSVAVVGQREAVVGVLESVPGKQEQGSKVIVAEQESKVRTHKDENAEKLSSSKSFLATQEAAEMTVATQQYSKTAKETPANPSIPRIIVTDLTQSEKAAAEDAKSPGNYPVEKIDETKSFLTTFQSGTASGRAATAPVEGSTSPVVVRKTLVETSSTSSEVEQAAGDEKKEEQLAALLQGTAEQVRTAAKEKTAENQQKSSTVTEGKQSSHVTEAKQGGEVMEAKQSSQATEAKQSSQVTEVKQGDDIIEGKQGSLSKSEAVTFSPQAPKPDKEKEEPSEAAKLKATPLLQGVPKAQQVYFSAKFEAAKADEIEAPAGEATTKKDATQTLGREDRRIIEMIESVVKKVEIANANGKQEKSAENETVQPSTVVTPEAQSSTFVGKQRNRAENQTAQQTGAAATEAQSSTVVGKQEKLAEKWTVQQIPAVTAVAQSSTASKDETATTQKDDRATPQAASKNEKATTQKYAQVTTQHSPSVQEKAEVEEPRAETFATAHSDTTKVDYKFQGSTINAAKVGDKVQIEKKSVHASPSDTTWFETACAKTEKVPALEMEPFIRMVQAVMAASKEGSHAASDETTAAKTDQPASAAANKDQSATKPDQSTAESPERTITRGSNGFRTPDSTSEIWDFAGSRTPDSTGLKTPPESIGLKTPESSGLKTPDGCETAESFCSRTLLRTSVRDENRFFFKLGPDSGSYDAESLYREGDSERAQRERKELLANLDAVWSQEIQQQTSKGKYPIDMLHYASLYDKIRQFAFYVSIGEIGFYWDEKHSTKGSAGRDSSVPSSTQDKNAYIILNNYGIVLPSIIWVENEVYDYSTRGDKPKNYSKWLGQYLNGILRLITVLTQNAWIMEPGQPGMLSADALAVDVDMSIVGKNMPKIVQKISAYGDTRPSMGRSEESITTDLENPLNLVQYSGLPVIKKVEKWESIKDVRRKLTADTNKPSGSNRRRKSKSRSVPCGDDFFDPDMEYKFIPQLFSLNTWEEAKQQSLDEATTVASDVREGKRSLVFAGVENTDASSAGSSGAGAACTGGAFLGNVITNKARPVTPSSSGTRIFGTYLQSKSPVGPEYSLLIRGNSSLSCIDAEQIPRLPCVLTQDFQLYQTCAKYLQSAHKGCIDAEQIPRLPWLLTHHIRLYRFLPRSHVGTLDVLAYHFKQE